MSNHCWLKLKLARFGKVTRRVCLCQSFCYSTCKYYAPWHQLGKTTQLCVSNTCRLFSMLVCLLGSKCCWNHVKVHKVNLLTCSYIQGNPHLVPAPAQACKLQVQNHVLIEVPSLENYRDGRFTYVYYYDSFLSNGLYSPLTNNYVLTRY